MYSSTVKSTPRFATLLSQSSSQMATSLGTVLPTDNLIYLDNANLFDYEENVPGSPVVLTSLTGRMYRTVESQQEPAVYTANVQFDGQLSPLLTRIEQGEGYVPGVKMSIAPPKDPTGTRAGNVQANVVNGNIISAQVLSRGSGYDPLDPPTVLMNHSLWNMRMFLRLLQSRALLESLHLLSPLPDSGPGFSRGIRFGYRVEPGTITAELQAGDSIVIANTVVGNGVVSQGDSNSTLDKVGVGTQFLDCTYQVASHTPLSFTGVIEVNVSSGTNYPVST